MVWLTRRRAGPNFERDCHQPAPKRDAGSSLPAGLQAEPRAVARDRSLQIVERAGGAGFSAQASRTFPREHGRAAETAGDGRARNARRVPGADRARERTTLGGGRFPFQGWRGRCRKSSRPLAHASSARDAGGKARDDYVRGTQDRDAEPERDDSGDAVCRRLVLREQRSGGLEGGAGSSGPAGDQQVDDADDGREFYRRRPAGTDGLRGVWLRPSRSIPAKAGREAAAGDRGRQGYFRLAPD